MSETELIYSLLRRMMTIYPEFRPANPAETFQTYADLLADLDPADLWDAVNDWMREQKWFPRPAELRQAALRKFETRGRHPSDAGNNPVYDLAGRRVALEEAFYHDGSLDSDDWERLAADYEAIGHVEAALAVRRKYIRLAATLEPSDA